MADFAQQIGDISAFGNVGDVGIPANPLVRRSVGYRVLRPNRAALSPSPKPTKRNKDYVTKPGPGAVTSQW